jgi:prophage regulatory protein
MPGVQIRKTTLPVQVRGKDYGQSGPPQQLNQKKLPRSQKLAEASLDGTSYALDDVSFLRLPEVKAVTGLSKTSLYALVREKSFPAPVRLGPRAVGWLKSEVKQWAVERVHASRSAA